MKKYLFSLFFFFCTTSIFAAELSNALQLPPWFLLTGHLDFTHAQRFQKPNKKLTTRLDFRLAAQLQFEWYDFFISSDAEKNWQYDDESGLCLRELWLDHEDMYWSLRLGRQIITWGKADGVRITDAIYPLDLTEPLTTDLEEMRFPVEAARFQAYNEAFRADFILVPFFKKNRYPSSDSLLALPQGIYPNFFDEPHGSPPDKSHYRILPAQEPAETLENMTAGGRLSVYFPEMEASFSALYTWEHTPSLHPENGDLRPIHHRLTILGLSLTLPFPDFAIRSEGAFTQDAYIPCSNLGFEPLRKNIFRWLFGMDWTPGYGFAVTTQIIGKHINDYEKILAADRNSFLATLKISQKFQDDRIELSNMTYCDINNVGICNRTKADLAVMNNFHLLFGADFFQAYKGFFDYYENNCQFWVKTKITF